MRDTLHDWQRVAKEQSTIQMSPAFQRYWDALAEISGKLAHLYTAQEGEAAGLSPVEAAGLLPHLQAIEARVAALEAAAAAPKWWQFWRKRGSQKGS